MRAVVSQPKTPQFMPAHALVSMSIGTSLGVSIAASCVVSSARLGSLLRPSSELQPASPAAAVATMARRYFCIVMARTSP